MRQGLAWAATFLLCLPAVPLAAAEEEMAFDVTAFEKKSLEWGGYAEVKGEHLKINEDGALARLNLYRDPHSTLDRLGATLQLNGSLRREAVSFHWLAQAAAAQDDQAWSDKADLYEGYLSLKAALGLTFDLGKKVFKWGKGYAWNPVAYIARAKDPDDPEESMEGFTAAGLDLIKSFDGPLRTVALTTVALPVWQGVNEDFGERDQVNLAAKLYLLLYDTDIDLVAYTGNSRSSRFGFDFSKNLFENLEIHGEFSHTPRQPVRLLMADNSVATRTVSDTSWLLGLRHLSERELTTIVEYYHHGDGYTEEEMDRFFTLAADGIAQYETSGATTLLGKAANVSQLYGRPQPGRNYLYARLSQKEPFDMLYFSPGLTAIVNLDDHSFSLAPEAVYTGFTNWELRLRLMALLGTTNTEYGDKQNSSKVEVRVRWFF